MSTNRLSAAVSLLCDPQGAILRVIKEGLGFDSMQPGHMLAQFIAADNRRKFDEFFKELLEKKAVLGREFTVQKNDQTLPVVFSGVAEKSSVLIVAVPKGDPAVTFVDLYEELSPVEGIKADGLRNEIRSRTSADQGAEIIRLNKELVNLQREIVKKNAELERLTGEIQKLSISDPLTGVYNRRGFFEIGVREIARVKRFGYHLSIIIVDIDLFQQINDTYGHAIGDAILVETAKRCRAQTRKVDIIGRYGGDEFVLLLPETQMAEACLVADRLRTAFLKAFKIEQQSLSVTISLGVAGLKEDMTELSDLLDKADHALVRAKEAGRNCVKHA